MSQKSNIRMTPQTFLLLFVVVVVVVVVLELRFEKHGSSVVECLLMVRKVPGSKSALHQKYYVMCALLCSCARHFTLICSIPPRWIKLGTSLGWGINRLVVQWTHSSIYNHLAQPLWKGDTSGCTENPGLKSVTTQFTLLFWFGNMLGHSSTLLPVHVCR